VYSCCEGMWEVSGAGEAFELLRRDGALARVPLPGEPAGVAVADDSGDNVLETVMGLFPGERERVRRGAPAVATRGGGGESFLRAAGGGTYSSSSESSRASEQGEEAV
jgi:hypothetical protein